MQSLGGAAVLARVVRAGHCGRERVEQRPNESKAATRESTGRLYEVEAWDGNLLVECGCGTVSPVGAVGAEAGESAGARLREGPV